MRTIRKKTTNIQLKYTPSAGWLDINFGEEVFRLLKGEVMLDKTPYSDETLVPIENLAIEGDIFSYQAGKTLYKMDCSTMEGAIDLALLVQKLKNETKIVKNSIDEDFEIILEEKKLSFSIGNFNRMILIDYNKYRNQFTERFPEPTKCYTMGDYYVENGIIYIQTIGRNLDDENDPVVDYQYQWHLKLNKVLQTTLEKLLEIGRGKKNIFCTLTTQNTLTL